MRLVLVHAVLLVSALGFAYQTWTSVEDPAESPRVILWDASPDEVVSIVYERESQRVTLEHRRDDQGNYLWATVTQRRADNDRTSQFLVGQRTDALLEDFASLSAIRDLGTVDDAKGEEYGLAGSSAGEGRRLSVHLSGDVTRELLVGDAAYATGARYVQDTANERVYLIQASLINSLENAEGSLRERRAHDFDRAEVASATLRTLQGERTMSREQASTGSRGLWAPPEAPDQADQTFTHFMERVERLTIQEFAPDKSPELLQSALRIEYFDADETRIGYLELLREDEEDATEYYVSTEHTRVLARVSPEVAAPLSEDVGQLF